MGVVGVISPWNFPLHLSQRSVAPALALGNAVVIKPASDTPVTGGLLIARIFQEAGLPDGVLSVVVDAGSEIGDHFVAHPVPRLISFTGSTAVGQQVGAVAAGGGHLKKAALEMGGNAPLVVLDDADLDAAGQQERSEARESGCPKPCDGALNPNTPGFIPSAVQHVPMECLRLTSLASGLDLVCSGLGWGGPVENSGNRTPNTVDSTTNCLRATHSVGWQTGIGHEGPFASS